MTQETPTPLSAFRVSAEGRAQAITLPDTLTDAAPEGGYLWLHFDVGDAALGGWLRKHLPVTPARALVQAETRPRCDRVDEGLLLNLRGVNLNPGAEADDMVSVRLWVTETLIISTRKRRIWAVDALRQNMHEGTGPKTVVAFLAELVHELTKRIEKVSLSLVEDTDDLEEHALTPNHGLASDLADLRQSVIKLRRFVRPQSVALTELSSGRVWPLDRQGAAHLRETANRTVRTIEELDATADRLQVIQDHLDMLHAAALGRNNYVLSVVASIFLPLGFITGLFGINVGGMPWIESDYGFWIVTGGSIGAGIILYYLLRLLKWL